MTLEGLVVRAARPEDAAEVRRLSISFTPSAQEVPPEAFQSRFTAFLADTSWCLPVAQPQGRGRLIGYGLAQDFGAGLRATFTTGRVHDLFVDPDTRLGGTGRALMNFIFDWSRARPQPMILDWQASPSAIGFYEALGFEADRVGDFPEYPGFTLDHRVGQRMR
ncbi:GNAT family N-acetyltransferase [Arthrobacter sp. ok362]|uniref:GNAT family N-acetyltransferase n=1 Tax=Arthrobacter sp. ok362 TaxID=1761745 RepID=UPI000888EB16|nr:GNAT family N-acetyltransferase [Arthrobacter sp. ok362]SDL67243.1 L-amino acid N-acyltransferase YncA [Arthrobacter sp. ok362]